MTISSVAAAILPGVGETTPGDAGSSGLGGLFAGLIGSGEGASTADTSGSTPPTDEAVAEPAPPSVPDILSAAQVMAAAQVVPVTPVLAAALSLQGGLGAVAGSAPQLAVPVTPNPTTPTILPAGSTAVSAGDPVLPAVPSSAVPLAALPVTDSSTNAAAPTSAADAGGTHSDTPTAAVASASAPETARTEPVGAVTGPQVSTPNVVAAPLPGRADAPTPATAQVTAQVFPEIGRLVSRGDGTQRITLTLSPEALGEVRVVLTVRDGDVHVRMVGSEAAQQALRTGAPELHRLLDLAGASSSQIVVGDQGASSDAGQQSGPSADRSAQRETQDHRTAGTRDGDTSARDGSDGGQHPRSSTDPTATPGGPTRTHPGVDVTM